MGDQATDFVTGFHSLEGDRISDRKKNFNKLLRDPTFSTNKQQIHDALDKLEPKTYLESLFKVDALIYFRHTTRLFAIIKEGNEVFISKILKQNWFFKEVFETMDANSLVNEFLPCLSLAMRMKVLKRLSLVLPENKMDEIYDSLHKRYGLWIAKKILHTCTKEKLQAVFNSEQIYLRVNQVLYLFKKNSDLFEMYIDYYNTFNDAYDESKITEYIAIKNPELLLKLEKQKKIDVTTLGRRTSKKMYGLIKDDVSADFERYQYLLNKSVLIKKMGDEFKRVYFKRFPKKINELSPYSECRLILRYYPKSKRWDLFKETFLAKFPNKDLNELFSVLGNNINQLNLSKSIAVNWAEYNYQKTNDDSFLKYLPPSKAITLIKAKINLTSDISKRRNLLELLLQTCKENDDLTALEEVLKYICFRHRNEDTLFKKLLLSNIKNTFVLQQLNGNHWKYINEIIKILEIQNEFEFWKHSDFLTRHLEFLVKSGEEVKEYLVQFIEHTIGHLMCFNLKLENPEIERKLINEMITIFPETMKDRTEKVIYHCDSALIKDVIDFNEKYPNYYIDLGQSERFSNFVNKILAKYQSEVIEKDDTAYEVIAKILLHKSKFPQCTLQVTYDHNLVDLIIKCCKHDGIYRFGPIIKYFVLKKSRNDFDNLLLQSYFQNIFSDVHENSIVNWFLKNDPSVLIPYLNIVYEKKTFGLKFKLIKLYSHYNFDKEAIKTSKKKLESDNTGDYLEFVRILRTLLPTDEFSSFIDNKFAPTKTKLDLEDEEMKKYYDIQCRIAKQLHKVEEPSKILLIVLKFGVGDYLQSALPSIQGTFYKSPEKELYSHVEKLSDKSVSVRKHVVFLSCELLKQEYVIGLLTTEDTNVSSQKHLFKATLKYFSKNPSQELLNLVVKNMSTIDKNDTETLQDLIQINIPKRYKGFYIEKCWAFYESMKSNGLNVETYHNNLLINILSHEDILVSLPLSFIDNIIDNYFCSTLSSNLLIKFVIQFLIHVGSSNSKYIKIVLKKLSTTTKELGQFVNHFGNLKVLKEFMTTFTKYWNEQFDITDTLEEHIMIKLFLFDSESHDSRETVAQNIVLYLEELIEQFTLNVFELFKIVFEKFLSFKKRNEQYELLYDMVKFKPSANMCILILCVIDPIDDNEDQNFELYQNIIDAVKTCNERIVRIYYKRFIRSNELE